MTVISNEQHDTAIGWRDEQIAMLRQNTLALAREIESLRVALAAETARADRAEDSLRILREEVNECRTK